MEIFYKNKLTKKNILISLLMATLTFLIVLVFTAFKFYKTAFIREEESKVYEKRENYLNNQSYIEKIAYDEEISLNSNDNNLEKWYYLNERDNVIVSFAHKQPNYTNKWVVVVHGYGESSLSMNKYGEMFFDEGYNVLLVDNEYHGESEGNHISMGYYDSQNVLNWCEEIVKADKNSEIVLFGLSMGASTVMNASNKDLNPVVNIKAVVEDCGYTSMDDIFTYQLYKDYGLPRFPIISAVDTLNYFKNGYRFNDITPYKSVENTDIPMLFIHGDEDDYVPFEMVDKLYNAHQGEKELYIVEGAKHANSIDVDNERYKETVLKFVKKYI